MANKLCGLHTCTIDTRIGSPPPLEGSSCTVGGMLRGKAIGNVFNLGDTQEMLQEPISVKGTLKVYTTLVASASQKPTMILKVNAFPTMAPLLKKLSSHYPTVKSKFNIL